LLETGHVLSIADDDQQQVFSNAPAPAFDGSKKRRAAVAEADYRSLHTDRILFYLFISWLQK
jgi:hypothetical protein